MDYLMVLIISLVCWAVSSDGESRNSTVDTIIFGLSSVALVFLRLFNVL